MSKMGPQTRGEAEMRKHVIEPIHEMLEFEVPGIKVER